MTAKQLPPVPDAISEHVTTDGNIVYVSDIKNDNAVYLHWLSKARLLGGAPIEKVIPAHEFNQRFRRSDGVTVNERTTRAQQSMINLITQASAQQSSDIHISLTEQHAELEFRINGDIERNRAIEHATAVAMMSTTMSTLISDGAKGNKPTEIQNARISSRGFLPESVLSVRVAATPMAHRGRLMSLRLLYRDAGTVQGSMIERLVSLGYAESQALDMSAVMLKPQGALVIAGTTGSGKSTTGKHLLEAEKQQRPHRNIITVEDPAEYPLTDQGIKQLSVPDTLDDEARRQAFLDQLRVALRLDPDLLYVGEVRDRITLNTMIEASLTGHNVLTTFHGSSPLGILKRFELLMKSPETLEPLKVLADEKVISGLAYQKLIKTVCPHCAKPWSSLDKSAANGLLERLVYVLDEPVETNQLRFINEEGCSECQYSGVSGRTTLVEVMNTDSILFELLLTAGYEAAYHYWRHECGGLTIQQHAAQKVARGEVDMRLAESIIGLLDSALLAETRRDDYFKRNEVAAAGAI